jgi:hypothetical protein
VRIAGVTERAVRDAHLLTRFSSWLYFGGMAMSESITELRQGGAEECKIAPSKSECTWAEDLPCDCAWNDVTVRGTGVCIEHPMGSRRLQKVFFEGQSQDTGKNDYSYFYNDWSTSC